MNGWSVNKVILISNLRRDPEVRKMNSGDSVVSFSLATGETGATRRQASARIARNGTTSFIFNENLRAHRGTILQEGLKIYLEGQLQTRDFTDKDGNQRHVTEVVLQRFRGELTCSMKPQRGP